MLKLSANGEYSLILVKFLINNKNETFKIKDLSGLIQIPESILRKIVNRLDKAEVLESRLGRNGGVRIKKEEISVYEVLEISGEDLNIAACSTKACDKKKSCEIGSIIGNLQRGFDTILKITKI